VFFRTGEDACTLAGGATRFHGMINRAVELPNRATTVALLLLLASSFTALEASWQSTVTKDPPGSFPELRPLRASYHFGWAGVTAASGEVHFTKASGDRFQLEAVGRTTGFVRDRKSTRLNSSHTS